MTTVGSQPFLPAPRVRQAAPAVATPGLLRDGTAIDCYGTLIVSITDLPEILRTSPAFKCQVELGRYVGLRRRGGGTIMPSGLYHPSPWVGGVGTSGSGGTRGGGQNLPAAVDRPSEWPVLGLPFGGALSLTSGAVLAPWAQRLKINDLNANAVETLDFAFRPRRRNARPPGSFPNTLVGVFAFRYAFFDYVSNRWVSGPWSERVYARPKGYPLARYPVGPFPALDTVLPDRASFRELSFSIGSRVR